MGVLSTRTNPATPVRGMYLCTCLIAVLKSYRFRLLYQYSFAYSRLRSKCFIDCVVK